MKNKIGLLVLFLFFAAVFPSFGQTLLGQAAGDFFSAFARMAANNIRLDSLENLKPYIPYDVFERMEENLVYRTAFIGFAVNQHGVISGNTSSVGFANTLNALTGFIMLIEKSDEITEWTIGEISSRYEQILATSWRNANVPLFMTMLEAYCAYIRGELWQ
jgi:hypothetical protein